LSQASLSPTKNWIRGGEERVGNGNVRTTFSSKGKALGPKARGRTILFIRSDRRKWGGPQLGEGNKNTTGVGKSVHGDVGVKKDEKRNTSISIAKRIGTRVLRGGPERTACRKVTHKHPQLSKTRPSIRVHIPATNNARNWGKTNGDTSGAWETGNNRTIVACGTKKCWTCRGC